MNIYNIIILLVICLTACVFPAKTSYSAGELRKLKGISDSMDAMDAQDKIDGINYQKALSFLNGPDIKQGISQRELTAVCGGPVSAANNGTRWVYKPPASTYFRGDKIYFYFDDQRKLSGWEKISQK
ncbi:MAG: hypothetical protein PHV77_02690 [Candidatus Omnitrophica bacterium]|jgi:hypothetical protein|nr:hypothetical protein [Candidatus Omnitrophota bacterium]